MKDSKSTKKLPIAMYTPMGTAGVGIIVMVIAGLKWGLVAAATVLTGAGLLKLARRRYPLDADGK